MDTKKLRQKILDLAIRGKFVPKDPNDEPASVLLERIKAEKERLIKEGKIKKGKKSAKTSDTPHYPYLLPKGWEWCKLEDIAYVVSGSTPAKTCFVEKAGIPYIKMYNLRNQQIDFDYHPQYITEDTHNGKLQRSRTEVGDLIMNIVGPPLGKLALIPPTLPQANFNQAAVLIRPYMYKEILALYLKSYLEEMSEIDSVTTRGSAGQVYISLTQSQNMRIPLPPLAEQHRIVTEIERWFSLISNIESGKNDLRDTIKQAKNKILDLAIHGKLVPQDPNDEPASILLERIRAEKEELIKQGKIKRDKKESVIFKGEDNSYYETIGNKTINIDDEIPFELPEGWEWCNLSMIGQTNIGLTYNPDDISLDGTMVLRSSNIVNNRLDLTDLVRVNTDIRENQYIENNDILICARNGSKALVGKCALIRDMHEKASFGAFMAIYITQLYNYVLYFLQTTLFRDVFYDSNSTTINQLTQAMIKSARIPLPPLAEQTRIVRAIETAFTQLDEIANSIA